MEQTFAFPYPPSVSCLPKTAGVYLICDCESDRFYVGSSINIWARWNGHVYRLKRGDHPNQFLQNIWNADSRRLECRVLELLSCREKSDILAAEQRWLDAAGVGINRDCMNVLAIAGSHLGAKRSEETRLRLSEANRGRHPSEAVRRKMSLAKLGRHLSDDTKRKIGSKSKGRPGPIQTAEALARSRKYTAEQVGRLRRLVALGMPVLHAAREIGISRSTAARIIDGESYVGFGSPVSAKPE